MNTNAPGNSSKLILWGLFTLSSWFQYELRLMLAGLKETRENTRRRLSGGHQWGTDSHKSSQCYQSLQRGQMRGPE